ncbi:MAG: cyclic nucleotide-binding domain-containing protein [Magnetococcales bacterium]|nr:cyclic nucleotide-binding domain-containing protein [Magnetococcales bacterium]
MNKDDMLRFLIKDDMARLSEKSTRRVFKKGDIILKEGVVAHSLYRLIKGSVKVVKDVRGEDVVISRLGPGELLGIASLLNGTAIMATVVAKEESEFELIALHDLQSLLESMPGLAVRFYRSLGAVLMDRLDLIVHQVVSPESS